MLLWLLREIVLHDFLSGYKERLYDSIFNEVKSREIVAKIASFDFWLELLGSILLSLFI